MGGPRVKRVVLFLGAGASKPFGCLLTGELLPEILKRIDSRNLFGRDGDPQDIRDLAEFLTALMPGVSRENAPLITDVLSLIDEMLVSGFVPHPTGSDSSIGRVRKLLEHAIFRVLRQPLQQRRLLEQLVTPLVDATGRGRLHCTIISTNYDIIVERELYGQLGCSDRQNGSKLAAAVDLGMPWRDVVNGRVHLRPGDPWFVVLKLHGSMNWLRCNLCGHIYVNPRGTIHHQAFRDTLDDHNTCHCGHGPLSTVIVAPSFVRDMRDGNLASIWRTSLEQLRLADRWVFAGYSLPPEDIAIRSLLIRGLNAHAKEKAPEVVVGQLGDVAKERYRLFFPDCKYIETGLKGLVEHGIV